MGWGALVIAALAGCGLLYQLGDWMERREKLAQDRKELLHDLREEKAAPARTWESPTWTWNVTVSDWPMPRQEFIQEHRRLWS